MRMPAGTSVDVFALWKPQKFRSVKFVKDEAKKSQPQDMQATAAFESGIETDADEGKSSNPGIGMDFGRYKIEGVLGEGAMGSVFLAHDSQLNRKVALKIPKFAKTASEKVLKRFYREARSAATLTHPNICQVYDVGEISGTHYIAMAYLKGHPLSEYIIPDKPIDQQTSALIIRKVALALQEAHSTGIVHRDIKPANIMIDHRKEPILMDFGLAAQEETIDDQTRLTQNGAILGSPAYMSREQLEGNTQEISHTSDIYSLGVVFFELLTSHLPFKGSGSVVSMIGEILAKDTPDPRSVRKNVNSTLAKICQKAMAKEPQDRFQSMAEMAEAIKRGLTSKQADVSDVKLAEKAQMAKKLYQKEQYAGAITVLEEIVETGNPNSKEVKAANSDLRKLRKLVEQKEAQAQAQQSGSWFDDDIFSAAAPASALPDVPGQGSLSGIGTAAPGTASEIGEGFGVASASPAFTAPKPKPKASKVPFWKIAVPVMIAIVGTLVVAYFLFKENSQEGKGETDEEAKEAKAAEVEEVSSSQVQATSTALTQSKPANSATSSKPRPRQSQNVETLFASIDRNNNQVIDADELDDRNRHLTDADQNQDRQITLDEFVAYRDAVLQNPEDSDHPNGRNDGGRRPRNPLADRFSELDQNRDQVLTEEEMLAQDDVPVGLRDAFRRADQNSDGQVTKDELDRMRPRGKGLVGGLIEQFRNNR